MSSADKFGKQDIPVWSGSKRFILRKKIKQQKNKNNWKITQQAELIAWSFGS